MTEKERKFKLKYLPTQYIVNEQKIHQGYLMFDGAKHLRVRLIEDKFGIASYLTLKTIKSDSEKEEYEFSINPGVAKELLDSTEEKLTKTRYKSVFQGNTVDIDCFEDGTSWVEIEYEEELNDVPEYCGEEITGIKEFSNIYIAKQNAKKQ